MAEYMRFPSDAINHKIPDSLPAHHAAYIEPLSCAIHAVQRARIELDDVVVIAGCGPLGLGMVAAARLKNPACLVALDLKDYRLDVARKAGADLVFNPDTTDVVAEIRKITDGYGCDVYIEATGYARGVTQGLQMIRRLGRFVEFSVLRELVTTDWTVIGDTKELDILGSHLGPYCYPKAIEMLVKDQVPVADIVTHTLPLEKYTEALNLVDTATSSIKVVLKP
jgi:threonine dehydrogenase-like Zn-dependent dehydrogenase